METLRQELIIGEEVRLDKEFRNTSIVKVIRQSPAKLFTTVANGKHEWDVMTNRLSKLENKY
jgi:hypothetical protein